ncbi:MAG TPA: hypothetical protein VN063_08065 [Methylophilaceae bacterium]|nr:hypothetical protein [Methylophilaceae bacterium]
MSAHRVISMAGHKASATPHQAQLSPRTGSRRHIQETWFDYASHTGTAARQRVKLVAEGLAERLKHSAGQVQRKGRQKVKRIGLHAALAASHKLVDLASRIERRLNRLNDLNERQ